jgi:hypothetical protein
MALDKCRPQPSVQAEASYRWGMKEQDHAMRRDPVAAFTRAHSDTSVSDKPRRQWNGETEREFEEHDAERGYDRTEDESLAPAHFFTGQRANDNRKWSRDEQTGWTDRAAESDDSGKDEQGTAKSPALDRLSPRAQRLHRKHRTECAEKHGEGLGHHARAHSSKSAGRQAAALPERKRPDAY